MPFTLDAENDVLGDALSSESFDVLDFVSGASLPTDEVAVYTDKAAAYNLNKKLAEAERVRAEAKAFSKSTDQYGLDDEDPATLLVGITEELDELYAELDKSKLIFGLKGLAPKMIDAIEAEKRAKHGHKEADTEDTAYFEDFNYTVMAKTITSVTRGDGAVSQAAWDSDRIRALAGPDGLHTSQFNVLWQAVLSVNYNAKLFDQAVSPDFS